FVPTDTLDFNTPADTTVYLDVAKADVTTSWATPSPISFGTALSGTQLNATFASANTGLAVAGTATYSPAAGTVLSAGTHHSLAVHFVPTDTLDFNTPADTTVYLDVAKADVTASWAKIGRASCRERVRGTQVNATFARANTGLAVAGTATYSPAAGTVLSAGTHQALDVRL